MKAQVLGRGGWSIPHPGQFPSKQLNFWKRKHRYWHSTLSISSISHAQTERDIIWVIIVLTSLLYTQNDKITQCCKRKYVYGQSILGSSSGTLGKLESILSFSSNTHGRTGWVVHLNYFRMIFCPYKLCLLFLSLNFFFSCTTEPI